MKHTLNNPPDLTPAFCQRAKEILDPMSLTEPQYQSFWRTVRWQGEDKFVRSWQDHLCDCLMVEFAHIFVGIEPDGYAHS